MLLHKYHRCRLGRPYSVSKFDDVIIITLVNSTTGRLARLEGLEDVACDELVGLEARDFGDSKTESPMLATAN